MSTPVADLDIFYISYDEPKAEERFRTLSHTSPHEVKRIHGIKGFDAAHRAAAEASTTERFITVDGDNHVVQDFFDRMIDDEGMKDVVFSFKAKNAVNGLEYGNGGVKIWPKKLVLKHPTHERAEDASGKTDFCWSYRYMQVDFLASHVFSADSPLQAFRSGYREGVKMTLVDGERPSSWEEMLANAYRTNLSRLQVWLSVGAECQNGWWSIYGARQGLVDSWLDDEPVMELITDYESFGAYFEANFAHYDAEFSGKALSRRINNELGGVAFSVVDLDAPQSAWFKRVFINPARSGLMIPHMKPLDLDD